MQKNDQIKNVLRFRHWSRKGYAIFCCLGRCVTIGNLNKEVTDISLGKQQTVFRLSVSGQTEGAEIAWEGDSDPLPDFVWQQVVLDQLPTILAEKNNCTVKPAGFEVFYTCVKPDRCFYGVYPVFAI